jgi:septal ring factor EnvC (AmiA/AmiB activator)
MYSSSYHVILQRNTSQQTLAREQKTVSQLAKEKADLAQTIQRLTESLSSTETELETVKAKLDTTNVSLHQEMNKVQSTEQQLSMVTEAHQQVSKPLLITRRCFQFPLVPLV